MTQAIKNHRNSLEELTCAIDWSEGEFTFILALCNSTSLQKKLVSSLETTCSLKIQQLVLGDYSGTLFQTIQAAISQAPPQALIIFGLESVNNLEELLVSANQIREEFREHYPFPLVVWVTDQVLSKLIRIAPDFYSWATTVHFAIATEELINFIQQTADQIIAQILKDGATRFLDNTALNREIGPSRRTEIESAYKELVSRGVSLDPELEANLEFILGRTADCCSDLPRQHYERSLAIWETQGRGDGEMGRWGDKGDKGDKEELNIPIPNSQFPIPHSQTTNNQQPTTNNQQGCILYCLGTWWRNYGMQHRAEYSSACEHAKVYFRECIRVFEQGQQPELVAKFINALGDILERLQQWEELEVVGKKALALHQTYTNPFREARAYSFLAEVALAKSAWTEAETVAQAALSICESTIIDALLPASSEINSSLEWVRWFNQSSYLFALARAQKGLGKTLESIKNLEIALHKTKPYFEPELYLGILKELRGCYFEQGQYLTAFEFKQEQRSIEQQFGFRAFIGAGRLQPSQQVTNLLPKDAKPAGTIAPEIAASGRQQDIKRLVERIGRPDHKLTVIYGQSGVGKSSIVQAGLIPALKQQTIGTRDVVPIRQQVYTHWLTELASAMSEALAEAGNVKVDAATLNSTTALIEQLRNNHHHNLLSVLIFDQFEEFFFVCQDPQQRRVLYDFLRQCFNIPYLKIIFSLREDYLHYLLDFDRLTNLDVINNNILDKHIIYYLGNFSPAEAKSVIASLTEKTQFYLEPVLIEQLVQDLAGDLGEVRPIELQVVGAQLQAENITTLAQYQEYGTKEELVKGYLTGVIKDCGPENEEFARLLLYLLTDEHNTRPLKTRDDLARDLQPLKGNLAVVSQKLDLVLKIFVASGLVFLVPETQADRYQLVHDYLVTFVRQQKTAELLLELQEAEKQRQLSEQKLNRFLKQALRAAVAAVGVMAFLAIALGGFALKAKKEAQRATEAQKKMQDVQEDQIRALSRFSETLRNNSPQEFDALIEAIRAGKQLQEHTYNPAVRSQVIAALRRAVYDVRERNRLSGHSEGVVSASFSSDGQIIATASEDGTVKLWNLVGEELQTFSANQEQVTEVRFSRDGYTFATTGEDGTVKLWKLGNGEWGIGNGELGIGNKLQPLLLHTLISHRDGINSISFSSNGKLVTGSKDWHAKLWSQEGQLLETLTGHGSWVTSVSFSRDNQTIATASLDKTAKLWTGNGEYLTTMDGHEGGLTSVSFSPDGLIATGSEDRTIKLWSQQGQFLQTLKGHYDTLTSVSFSPNGQQLASGSEDTTVKLWSKDGKLLQTLRGHDAPVNSVSFSPNGQLLLTASGDKTVKLWSLVGEQLQTLTGHPNSGIRNVAFSPDGKIIATASTDQTIKLWNWEAGKISLRQTLVGHQGEVRSISFSPNGKLIATASTDKTLKLWNIEGEQIQTLTGHQGPVFSVSFAPDGKMIASASADKTVKLWNLKGEILNTITGHEQAVTSVSFSGDGQTLASGSIDKTVKLWNLEGNQIKTLTGHDGGVLSVSFSPNGQTIASASVDGMVKLWSKTGKELKTLTEHKAGVTSISFSPDSQTLATASADQTVKLWSVSGEEFSTLVGHQSGVASVSFSPDGKTIASADLTGKVILWNLDLDDLLQRGCTWVGNYLKTNPEIHSDRDRALCDEE
ncbi:MAG: hypothetical protein F6K47_16855 [Symploca sp. SIO2E6]|nr:hypothetical protein [Symploca sp. SIO2E6]